MPVLSATVLHVRRRGKSTTKIDDATKASSILVAHDEIKYAAVG